jgi:hypothetical protein
LTDGNAAQVRDTGAAVLKIEEARHGARPNQLEQSLHSLLGVGRPESFLEEGVMGYHKRGEAGHVCGSRRGAISGHISTAWDRRYNRNPGSTDASLRSRTGEARRKDIICTDQLWNRTENMRAVGRKLLQLADGAYGHDIRERRRKKRRPKGVVAGRDDTRDPSLPGLAQLLRHQLRKRRQHHADVDQIELSADALIQRGQ